MTVWADPIPSAEVIFGVFHLEFRSNVAEQQNPRSRTALAFLEKPTTSSEEDSPKCFGAEMVGRILFLFRV